MAKVYTEKEAAEILQQAVKLQEASADAGAAYTPGITIDELRRIAEEAGLDPKYLEMAVNRKEGIKPQKSGFLNLVQEHERVIEGVLDPDSFDIVLDGLGKSYHRGGMRQVGRAVEGQFSKGFGFGWLKLTSRKGRTRLELRSNSLVPFMTTIYPTVIASAIASSALAERGMGLAGFGAAVAVLAAGVTAFVFGQKKGHATVAKLADEMEQRIVEETADMRERLAQPSNQMVEATDSEQIQPLKN